MNTLKHTTLIALISFAGAAATGCDAVGTQDLNLASGEARFATSSVSPEVSTPALSDVEAAQGADAAGTIEDLAHTATTQVDDPGASPVDTGMFDDSASTEPADEALLSEEAPGEATVVEDAAAEESSEVSPIAEIFEHASEPIAWSPAGTYKLPAYGAGCRFTTEQVIQIPSNGLVDDSLVFEADSGAGATLELLVETPDGLSMVAEVGMKRGLTGRSYRQATGDAAWTDKEGDHTGIVVDGTICFDEKLANGLDDVLAEFSLVVERDGTYFAMGGNVLLEGAQVAALEGFTVDGASAVDIDLR
jgi:hypothetical protein